MNIIDLVEYSPERRKLIENVKTGVDARVINRDVNEMHEIQIEDYTPQQWRDLREISNRFRTEEIKYEIDRFNRIHA